MPSFLLKLLLAARPWSFPASLNAVFIANALAYSIGAFSFSKLLTTVLGTLFIHTAGNLTNSYFDFKNGLDKKESADDRTLFEVGLTPSQLWNFVVFCYAMATGIGATVVIFQCTDAMRLQLFGRLVIGLILAFSYTADPLKLKYHALGDVAIFLCFGPLLVEGTFFVQTSRTSVLPIIFSIPIGLLTEAILHVNNTRDIAADKIAGAFTLAQLLGRYNYHVYVGLFIGSFASLVFLALWTRNFLLLLPFLVFPSALPLWKDFERNNWQDMCPKTALYGMKFAFLLCLAILLNAWL
jgi:1,4-dihydroxy-2-naphthoate octaprenyltransferase